MATCKEKPIHDMMRPSSNETLRGYWQQAADIYNRVLPIGTGLDDHAAGFAGECNLWAGFITQAFDCGYSVRFRMIALMGAAKHAERALVALRAMREADKREIYAHGFLDCAEKDYITLADSHRTAESFTFDRLCEYIGDNK